MHMEDEKSRRKSADKLKEESIRVRMTKKEKAAYQAAADEKGWDLSDWIREAVRFYAKNGG